MITVSPALKREIDAYVKSQYPKEACGFIVGGKFIPVENLHNVPEKSFSVSDEVFKQYAVNCTAFIHSHPDWYPVPSEMDMRQQIATAIPWGIIGCTATQVSAIEFFGDMLEDRDLKRRGFIHGITDCYDGIRDWFWQKRQIRLKQFPRSWEWWLQEGGHDFYGTNFKDAGFLIVPQDEIDKYGPQVGDVFIATLGKSKKPNHGGVYTGNGLGYHHISSNKPYDLTRLAVEEPIARYQQYITMWVRYNEKSVSVR